MAILVSCECGKEFRVPEEHAGKRGKCPACSRVVLVPRPAPAAAPKSPPAARPRKEGLRAEPAEVEVEVEELEEVPDDPPRVARKRVLDAEPADEPPGRNGIQKSPRKPALVRDDAVTTSRKTKTRRRRPRLGDDREAPPAGPSQLSTILGGLGMMAAAVVWFVGGLCFGILFYYPPVLFVVGLIAFIRGMMMGGD